MKFLLQRLALWTMLASAATLHALTIEASMDFLQDGSARATLEYYVPDNAAGIVEGLFLAASKGECKSSQDEKTIREFLERTPGIIVDGVNVYKTATGRRTRVAIRSKDPQTLLGSGILGPAALKKGEKSSRQTFRVPMPTPAEWTNESANQARMLVKVLGGLEMVLRVQTPSTIHSTTGTRDAYNRCHWQIGLEDLLQKELPEIKVEW